MKKYLLVIPILAVMALANWVFSEETQRVKTLEGKAGLRAFSRVIESLMPRAGGDDLLYRDVTNDRVGLGTNSPGTARVHVKQGETDAAAHSALYLQGGGGDDGGAIFKNYTRTGVAGSAVEIAVADNNSFFLLVQGDDDAASNGFIDTVSGGQDTVTVLHSVTGVGAPSARTYAASGGSITLQMTASTYTVHSFMIDLQAR